MANISDEFKEIKNKLDLALLRLKEEFSRLRTGRAQSALLDTLQVECYGTKMMIKELASITIPEPRLIVIEPWDKGLLKEIERAILSANLGLNPTNDGVRLRIALPPMTEERRRELTKQVSVLAEQTRITFRSLRKEFLEKLNRLEKEHLVSEDEKFRYQKSLDELIAEYNKEVEKLSQAKEKEILTV